MTVPTPIRNVSPLGALDIPLIGRTVEHGEVFEVTATQARELLKQSDNFEAVEKPKTEKKDD